jgi:hypothetical protein
MTEELIERLWDRLATVTRLEKFKRHMDISHDAFVGALKDFPLSPPPVDEGVERLKEAAELLKDAQYHLRIDTWAEQFNGRVNAFLSSLPGAKA